jgi:hypothetical protein
METWVFVYNFLCVNKQIRIKYLIAAKYCDTGNKEINSDNHFFYVLVTKLSRKMVIAFWKYIRIHRYNIFFALCICPTYTPIKLFVDHPDDHHHYNGENHKTTSILVEAYRSYGFIRLFHSYLRTLTPFQKTLYFVWDRYTLYASYPHLNRDWILVHDYFLSPRTVGTWNKT